MARTAAVALAFLAFMAGSAQATTFQVVVVPGVTLDDLEEFADRGAVGLLNPGAGPETSRALAMRALVTGEVRNSLREEEGLGGGPALVFQVEEAPLGSVEGNVIYVGLPEGGRQPNDRRYPILVVGPGFEGLLTSDSTRIPGLVSIADVAPTARGEESGLESQPAGDTVTELRELDDRIDENNGVRLPATILVCALVLALALFSPAAAVPALAAALLTNLMLGLAGVSEFWTVMAVFAVAVLLGGPLLASLLRSPVALGTLLVAVLGAYLLVLGIDGPSAALSPFGPTQNSRYFGLSNLLETMLLVPAFGGAALLFRRFGWIAFAGTALLAFATVAGNRFGADGGGAVVLAGGFAVLAVLLSGGGRRALALAVGVALALALGLAALDAATGGSSHVTRALDDGPVGLAEDLGERVELSWERTTGDWYVALAVALMLGVFAFLVVRTLRRSDALSESPVALAVAAAIAVSLVVNDSPTDVLLVGLTSYVAADVGMLLARWPATSRSSSPSLRSPLSRAAAAGRSRRRPPRP
jgi:hypothetical protein